MLDRLFQFYTFFGFGLVTRHQSTTFFRPWGLVDLMDRLILALSLGEMVRAVGDPQTKPCYIPGDLFSLIGLR